MPWRPLEILAGRTKPIPPSPVCPSTLHLRGWAPGGPPWICKCFLLKSYHFHQTKASTWALLKWNRSIPEKEKHPPGGARGGCYTAQHMASLPPNHTRAALKWSPPLLLSPSQPLSTPSPSPPTRPLARTLFPNMQSQGLASVKERREKVVNNIFRG